MIFFIMAPKDRRNDVEEALKHTKWKNRITLGLVIAL